MYGKKLKQIRKELKLTQAEMAASIDVSYRNYAAYERDENRPTLFMLETLSKIHNVNLNWFIADIGNLFNTPPIEQVEDQLTLKVESILRSKGII